MNSFVITKENATNLGTYLKEKRKEKNMTITDIEEASGINRADIHRLEGGQKKRLNPFQLAALAESLGTNSINLYILAGFITESAISAFVKEKTDKRIVEQLKIISYTGAKKIPVYNTFEKALGLEKNAEPINYTTLFLDEDAEYVGVFIEESPIKQMVSDNAIVIVEKTDSVENEDIGIFDLDGEILVRRYHKKENGIILYSKFHLDEMILVTDENKLKIYGKVSVVINRM